MSGCGADQRDAEADGGLKCEDGESCTRTAELAGARWTQLGYIWKVEATLAGVDPPLPRRFSTSV